MPAFLTEVRDYIGGDLMRLGTRPFDVGDWIAIDGQYGAVIDEGLLSFRLQEIDTLHNDYCLTIPDHQPDSPCRTSGCLTNDILLN